MLLVNRKPAPLATDNKLKTLLILNSFREPLGEVSYYRVGVQFFGISKAISPSWKGEITGR